MSHHPEYENQKHDLKILSEYFQEIITHQKTFEIRYNDRNYQVGDILNLSEYDPQNGYTGKVIPSKVTYILDDKAGIGLKAGYVCMAIIPFVEKDGAK